MLPTEKNIKALIKKVQKQVEETKKKKVEQPMLDTRFGVDRFEPNTASELFAEMKKLPFSE